MGDEGLGFKKVDGAATGSHVTALEPVDFLRANKRTRLTALRSRAPLVKQHPFFLGSKEARACVQASFTQWGPGLSAQP